MLDLSRIAHHIIESPEKPYQDLNDSLEYYEEHECSIDENLLNKIRLSVYGSIVGMTIWAVDGAIIRNEIDIDFTTGGNPARYKYIPNNEIWVESTLKPSDFAAVVMHETFEYILMKYYKLSYDDAHDRSNIFEWKIRQAIKDR